jgi:hypothetical protein
LVYDELKNGGQGNSHEFFAHHGCSEIKILKIEGGKAGARGRDDAVQEQFHCGEVSCGGDHFVGIVQKVSAYRESNALGFGFVGTLRGDEVSICCLTSRRELMVKKITHGFRAGGHVWDDTFGKASKFVCGAVQPLVSVGSSNQL